MWIVIEGKYSFQDEFQIYEVTKETPQRYYYKCEFGAGKSRTDFVDKKKVAAVFDTEEMAVVAAGRWVQEFDAALSEAKQEQKNLREKLNGMAIVISDLKRQRREAIARTGQAE